MMHKKTPTKSLKVIKKTTKKMPTKALFSKPAVQKTPVKRNKK